MKQDLIIAKQEELIEHLIPFTERCTIEETYKSEYQKWFKKRKQLESELASLKQGFQEKEITDEEIEIASHNFCDTLTNSNESYIVSCMAMKFVRKWYCTKLTHVMEFAEWCINHTARLYHREERFLILETSIELKSIEDIYNYWITNVKQ